MLVSNAGAQPVAGDGANASSWRTILKVYQNSSGARALGEILITFIPLALIWTLSGFAAWVGLWWVSLLLAAPAAMFMVRLFMIQHDCGHHSFFKSRVLNDWLGRVIGVLTLTPYDYWRHTHAQHHATAGDLDRRGLGDVKTLTVDEYRKLPRLKRIGYRLYRHPLVMFGLGPAWVFFIQHRAPLGLSHAGWRPWLSTMATNVAIVAFCAGIVLLGGWNALLLVYVPTMLAAASIGVWLFFVQHQFEQTYWRRHGAWSLIDAALHGSSHYDLPAVLRWLTANIGIHHVHHLSSRIPFYRLGKVLRDHPELKSMSRLGLLESFRCVVLSLWDEGRTRMVSFRQMKLAARAG